MSIFYKDEPKPTLPKGWRYNEGYVVQDAPEPTSNLVHDFRYSYLGETPELSFRDQLYYIERDAESTASVKSLQNKIVGGELQVNSDDETAKAIIEDWNDKTQFEQKLRDAVYTWLATGTTLLEKLNEIQIRDVLEVDMRTIIGKKRNNTGTKTEYYLQENSSGTPKPLGSDLKDANLRFIELSLSTNGRAEWGRGICYPNLAIRKVNNLILDSPILTRWKISDAMGKIFLNHAAPDKFVTYEGATKEYIDKKSLEYKKRKQGDIQIGDKKPDIDIIEPGATGKYGEWLTFLDKSYKFGTGFPLDILSGDFTSRASSSTTADFAMKDIKSMQRYLTSKLKKELYYPILIENGYNLATLSKINLTISFETESITELTAENVIAFVQNGIMSIDEGREWLKNNGQDLFDDANLVQKNLTTKEHKRRK